MRRFPAVVALVALVVLAGGCALRSGGAGSSTTVTEPVGSAGGETPVSVPGECPPPPVTQPTLPEDVPGYAGFDPEAGLHVTGDAVEVDLRTYRLEVSGRVEQPLSLTYDDLRCLPKVQATPRLVCPGYFVDVATWAGAPLRELLDRAGAAPDATALLLTSADGYSLRIELDQETLADGFLAYEVNGETLPVLHGFPVRLVLPGEQGAQWVKWLVGIEVL